MINCHRRHGAERLGRIGSADRWSGEPTARRACPFGLPPSRSACSQLAGAEPERAIPTRPESRRVLPSVPPQRRSGQHPAGAPPAVASASSVQARAQHRRTPALQQEHYPHPTSASRSWERTVGLPVQTRRLPPPRSADTVGPSLGGRLRCGTGRCTTAITGACHVRSGWLSIPLTIWTRSCQDNRRRQ